ncbi:MAG TPA: type II toxin-antitoxin system VapB family antitoxin, partial [bacterium]|nr:type II toxin-antitoxin system VapB family antitoxin [bacterium]
MRTTITLRDDLLKLARLETHAKSITAAVNEALEDWARRKRIDRIKGMAGKVHFDGDLKELRALELKKAEKLYA